VANWLKDRELSDEAQEVITKGMEVYKLYFSSLNQMATHKWKIATWDAGWYQIRRCLNEHNLAMDEIEEKILPKIEEFGFLDKDEVYEEI